MKLPEDIFKVVNRKNWSKLFDDYMLAPFPPTALLDKKKKEPQELEYLWKPEVMKKFIKAILKNK